MSMDTETVKARVRKLSFLTYCPSRAVDATVAVLAEIGELAELAEGEAIIRRGDVRGNNGYVLLDGEARVLKGKRDPISIQAPALIGELQQFSLSGSRSADVEAAGPAVVLRFEWPTLYEELEKLLRPLDIQSVKDAIRRWTWQYSFDDDDE